jgi:hypothetical protein
MCTRWVPWSLTVKYGTERKADGETFLSQIFTADETGSIVLNWRQKGNPWNGTILSLHGRRKFKQFCVSRQGHDHCLCGLQDDCCRPGAERETTLMNASGGVSNKFCLTLHQKSFRSMTVHVTDI